MLPAPRAPLKRSTLGKHGAAISPTQDEDQALVQNRVCSSQLTTSLLTLLLPAALLGKGREGALQTLLPASQTQCQHPATSLLVPWMIFWDRSRTCCLKSMTFLAGSTQELQPQQSGYMPASVLDTSKIFELLPCAAVAFLLRDYSSIPGRYQMGCQQATPLAKAYICVP